MSVDARHAGLWVDYTMSRHHNITLTVQVKQQSIHPSIHPSIHLVVAAVLSVRKVVVREVAPAILTVPEVGNDFAITSGAIGA
jgi:hypothetical protein